MAELGLAVAQTLFVALECSELKEICRIWGYKSQLEDLNKTVNTIKNVLLDAESKLLSNEARDYIQELKAAVYEADDLFDEFVTRLELKQLRGSRVKGGEFYKKVRNFFSPSESRFSQAYRMFDKAKKMQTNLNTIVDNHKKFALDVDYKPIYLRREETCSNVDVSDIIGRDDDKEAIIDKLLESKDQDVRFSTIVGVGGLGKTALAQLVYNDEKIQKEFGNLRFWVCVSDQDKQQFDKKAILSKILMLVTQGHRSFDAFNLEQLKNEFQKELQGKKYMLFLDDVWNENREKWFDLQKFLKQGKEGSRILVTTRSERTATFIGDDEHTYRLQGLSLENSWALFEMWAFNNQRNHENEEFLEIGDKIAAKCYNIPLAIKVVGSLLYGQDITKWRSVERSGLAGIGNGDNEIMSILKLSYHNLAHSLKSCFTYCAVFPKDYRIEKKKLIQLWMAQGYVVPFDKDQTIDEAAEEHFSILLQRCFFQDLWKVYGASSDEKIESVKIHDLMHDVAQEVVGDEIQQLGSGGISFGNEVCHLSFDGDNCPRSSSSRNKLRSYIYLYSEKLVLKQLELNQLKYLRVLDLRHLDDIKSLESIGGLLHLRYLCICKSSFEAFPANSITQLHNLQTLTLYGCRKLNQLPHDFGKLGKLRHLDISYCDELTGIPSGMGNVDQEALLGLYDGTTIQYGAISFNLVHITIRNCFNLQSMPSFRKLPYLKSLVLFANNGLKYIEETSYSSSYAEAQQTLFFPSLQYLELKCVNKLKGWFSGEGVAGVDHCLCRGFPRLSQLKIERCNALASFPCFPSVKVVHCDNSRILMDAEARGNGTPCLSSLTIRHDSELKSLSEIGKVFMSCAASLRSLSIGFCHNLVSISEGLEHLTMLESLELIWNDQLNISEDDIMPWKSFNQSLHSLRIVGLKNETGFPKGMQHLTSLQTLQIEFCSNLKNLPEWISCLSSLQHLKILETHSGDIGERCKNLNIPNIVIH